MPLLPATAGRSPDHPPPTPEYQGRCGAYVGGSSLGGDQPNGHMSGSRAGQDASRGNIGLHDHRWRGGGGGGGGGGVVGRQPVSVFRYCTIGSGERRRKWFVAVL